MLDESRWKLADGQTYAEFKADVHEFLGLVGVTEIAEKAGVKPQTVTVWRQRHTDFPEPAAELANGPIWFWSDLEEWVERQKNKGPGRPKKAD